MTTRFDIIVAGCGITGSTLALHLARTGIRVLVVEKSAWPRYKACGGGITARAMALAPTDLSPTIEQRVTRVSLGFGGPGLAFSLAAPAPLLFMAQRQTLDAYLAEKARAQGATLLTETRVESFSEDGQGVTVQTPHGVFQASFLVAADGVNSRIAARYWKRETRKLLPALECEMRCAKAVLGEQQEEARFEFDAVQQGYAWLFPKSDGLSLGVLTRKRGVNLRRALGLFIRQCVPDSAVTVRLTGHPIPASPRTDGFARGRVFLAGDAAGLVDPVTCEGIAYAFKSADLLARTFASTQWESAALKKRYENVLQEEVLPELKAARFLASFLYGPRPLRNALFRRHGQRACEAMADVMLGKRTYWGEIRNWKNWKRLLLSCS